MDILTKFNYNKTIMFGPPCHRCASDMHRIPGFTGEHCKNCNWPYKIFVKKEKLSKIDIRFFSPYCPDTGWLSNFYIAPIDYLDLTWNTSEHLYQALKAPEIPNYLISIHECITPRDAKNKSRELLKNEYDMHVSMKANIMKAVIYQKFKQHSNLAALLLKTSGNIIEASPEDSLWGEGEDGKGLNLMGRLLVDLREQLANELS